MMYGYGNGMGAWGYLLMAGAILAGLALVAAGALMLIRLTTDTAGRPEAERILEQRFARGEVDQDEFRSRMDVLRNNAHP